MLWCDSLTFVHHSYWNMGTIPLPLLALNHWLKKFCIATLEGVEILMGWFTFRLGPTEGRWNLQLCRDFLRRLNPFKALVIAIEAGQPLLARSASKKERELKRLSCSINYEAREGSASRGRHIDGVNPGALWSLWFFHGMFGGWMTWASTSGWRIWSGNGRLM